MTTSGKAPTHSEAAPPRKPRRLGLYVPWGIAVVAAVGWSLAWVAMMQATVAGLDATAAQLRAAGWRVSWASRETGGYPFRLDVNMAGLEVADPSGWALSVPELKSEAPAYMPGHRVFFVPDGRMTVTRPGDGPFEVAAGVLRGSVSGVGQGVPELALEAEDARFSPAAGAAALPLASAKTVQFEMRPGPDDQGAAYVSFDGGAAAPGGWLATLAGGAPVSLTADAIFGHASAFARPGLRQALSAWANAGGALEVQHLDLAAGRQRVTASAGRRAVGDDGRLSGQLPLTAGGQPLALDFHDGGAWLGSARVAPAPRLF